MAHAWGADMSHLKRPLHLQVQNNRLAHVYKVASGGFDRLRNNNRFGKHQPVCGQHVAVVNDFVQDFGPDIGHHLVLNITAQQASVSHRVKGGIADRTMWIYIISHPKEGCRCQHTIVDNALKSSSLTLGQFSVQ